MCFRVVLLIVWCAAAVHAQSLGLPPRAPDALTGSAFAVFADTLSLDAREEAVYRQIAAGNIPDCIRSLTAVTTCIEGGGTFHLATYYVTPDYLAIGSDADHLRMPMTPALAQRIADTLRCSLPTRKMVDDIYAAAPVKLRPQPIPPSPAMITMKLFRQHNDSIDTQLREIGRGERPCALIAGQKKDVVLTRTINNPAPVGRVAIYGWHRAVNDPIQPLYCKHKDTWADYSHGIRLVQTLMIVDGEEVQLQDVLANEELAPLVSDEGIIPIPRYPVVSQADPKK